MGIGIVLGHLGQHGSEESARSTPPERMEGDSGPYTMFVEETLLLTRRKSPLERDYWIAARP